MEEGCLRETIVEINLDHIAYNMQQIKKLVGTEVCIAAVVKANAYGHGAVAIAPTLMANGAGLLAVATLSEAVEIKKAYPAYPVLIMGLTPCQYLSYILDYDIVQTIDTYEQAYQLSQLAVKKNGLAKIHLKIDTGFHRLGFPDNEHGRTAIEQIFKLPGLLVEGIYSHLALTGDEENEIQFQRFLHFINDLKQDGLSFRYHHIADSISAVDYPGYHMDMVRIGALLYGLKGFHKGSLDLRQALTFKTKISHITKIPAGEGVGYDYLWKAPKDTLIGTLPFGYADGYPRNLRDQGLVSIKGRLVPVIGVICMDQCMVDLTLIPDAKVGDEVIIYGDGQAGTLSIHDISQLAKTNKNEIVSRLSPRPPRVYISKGLSL